jgi:hypothetical protein
MHDCSISTGDRWMKKHLDRYARWATHHNSWLVITFDENAGGTVNPIPTIFVGDHVHAGRYAQRINHYTCSVPSSTPSGCRPSAMLPRCLRYRRSESVGSRSSNQGMDGTGKARGHQGRCVQPSSTSRIGLDADELRNLSRT